MLDAPDRSSDTIPHELLRAVHRLVEANRIPCLWFMREDFLPRSVSEVERALTEIENHGDRASWVEARSIRAWLSRTTSATS